MQEEYFRIKIYKAPFPVTLQNEEYCKYKVFWEQVFHDDKGRRYAKVNKVCTYDSIDDMEADFKGFLCFIEYSEELDLNEEVAYDEADL